MHRCILAVILCALAGLTACSSTPDRDDAEPVVKKLQAPEMSLPMPEQTRMLMRVDPRELRAGLQVMKGYAPNVGAAESAAFEYPGKVLVAALLLRETKYQRIMKLPSKRVANIFPAMDSTRPMLVALSTRGNDGAFRHLENNVPPHQPEALPIGPSTRLFVPASDASALRSQMEQFCAQGKGMCRSVERFATASDYAVVDIFYDWLGPRMRKNAPALAYDEWDEADEGYWQRDTAALRAFLTRDAALSMYMRAEDLPAMGALQGAGEVLDAVGSVQRSRLLEMMNMGYRIAGQLFRLEAPQARETEDAAFFLRAEGDKGVVFDTVRSYTRQGAEVAEAADREIELPSLETKGALVEFDWVRDNGAAVEAAKLPRWAEELLAGEYGAGEAAEIFRNGGLWAYMIPVFSYPDAFRLALQEIVGDSGPRQIRQLQRADEVLAMRASLDWVADDKAPMGARPKGGVVVALDKDSTLDKSIGQMLGQLEQALQIEASMQSETRGDYKVIRVAFGEDAEIFGETSPVGRTMQARVDLAKLSAQLQPMMAMSGNDSPQMQMLWSALKRVETGRLDMIEVERGSAVRLALGTGALDAPELPRSAQPLASPEPAAACLMKARAAVREAKDAVGSDLYPQQMTELLERLRTELDAAGGECGGSDPRAAEEIAWMRAAWTSYAATYWARQMQWERAAKLYATACDEGHSAACGDAKRLARLRAQMRLPRISTGGVALDDVPAGPPLITREGLRWLSAGDIFRLGSRDELSTEQLAAGQFDGEEHQFLRRMPLETWQPDNGEAVNLAVILVDRTVPDTVLASLAALVAKKDMTRARREAQLLRQPVPPATPPELALAVEGPTDGSMSALPIDAPAESSAAAEIIIGADGIRIEKGGQMVAPVEGCPKDGPTLCVEDQEKTGERLDALLAGMEDEANETAAFDALARSYRLTQLTETLKALELDVESPTVAIRTTRTMPVGLLVDVRTAIGEGVGSARVSLAESAP